ADRLAARTAPRPPPHHFSSITDSPTGVEGEQHVDEIAHGATGDDLRPHRRLCGAAGDRHQVPALLAPTQGDRHRGGGLRQQRRGGGAIDLHRLSPRHAYDRNSRMKITASASEIADAFALAASLFSTLPATMKRSCFEMLGAVHIKAADDAATIPANALDPALTFTVPATVATAGELAISAARLAALAAAFPATATVEIAGEEEQVAHVRCGRSRFKLATLPLTHLPAAPKLTEETGRAELAREELLTLLRPAFAASTEQIRFYLGGVLLHNERTNLASSARASLAPPGCHRITGSACRCRR